MSKHTPGPWKWVVEYEDDNFEIVREDFESSLEEDGDVRLITEATVRCTSVATAWCDRSGDWKGIAVSVDDARLIAAAPELLECLINAVQSLETAWHEIDGEWGPIMDEFGDLEGAVSQGHCSTDAIRAARAAIAKATGKEI
jgi:hypothetical protein